MSNIIKVKNTGSEEAVVFFHAPVGIMDHFLSLAACLRVDCFVVKSPTLTSKVKLPASIPGMAQFYSKHLKTLLSNYRYVHMAGHSSGAYLALEAAVALSDDINVESLISIDCAAPLGPPDSLLNVYQDELERFSPPAVFTTLWLVSIATNTRIPFSMKELCVLTRRDRIKAAQGYCLSVGALKNQTFENMQDMIALHAEADSKYLFRNRMRITKFKGDILLIGCGLDTQWPGFNVTTPPIPVKNSMWKHFCEGGVTGKRCENSDHISLMLFPSVYRLANIINVHLNK